jgi:hypothetical protein
MVHFRFHPRPLLLIVAMLGVASSTALAGAWGEGSFDNDDALDWAAACAAAKSAAPVRETLERALRAKYLEAPEGSSAIAAAEVVAAAKGKANPKLPAPLAAWTKRQPARALSQLAPLASRVLIRVRHPKQSELRALWAEGDPAKWLAAIADLESRLR